MNIQHLAEQLSLSSLLDELRRVAGGYVLVDHWQQGEFHHDTLLRVDALRAGVPGSILMVATNCNGGIKELSCFAELPGRDAVWHERCPNNPEFTGELPALLARSRTIHWFDPCALLANDARSEIRAEFRERQAGGGWVLKRPACGVADRKD